MTSEATPVEWATTVRTRMGEAACGDAAVVLAHSNGVLVAAVDGMGHGAEAAHASAAGVAVLRAHPEAAVEELLERCHTALKDTRGAVMSLASLDARSRTMRWTGVGNVEGVLLRTSPGRREYLLLRPGVVGVRLPPERVASLPLLAGDVLVLATDGVRPGFAASILVDAPVQQISDSIMGRFVTGTDDALVLVVRWTGGAP